MQSYFRLLLTILASICFTACTKSGSGDPKTSACDVLGLETKILNGTRCGLTHSPVVQITILSADGGIATCSGSLLTSNRVLTAAHCFLEPDDVTSVTVQVEGIDIPAPRVVTHPSATRETLPQNDVAIVELGQSVNAATLPLVLSKSIAIDDVVSIFGFGLNDDSVAGQLRSGQMKILSINGQFISAEFSDKGSNTCFGDSGGPAVLTIENGAGIKLSGIVGITSFGTSAQCAQGDRSAFANVQGSSILNFITSQVPNVGVI